jgi:hypothetical protein
MKPSTISMIPMTPLPPIEPTAPAETGVAVIDSQLALQPLRELASGLRRLTDEALRVYSAEVAAIVRVRCRDESRIEHTLDGLLGFGYDEAVMEIYKTLCRYYVTLNPQATAEYVHACRDAWMKDASDA